MRRRTTIGIGTAVTVLAAGGAIAALTWPSAAGTPAGVALDGPVRTLPADPAPAAPKVRTRVDTLDLEAAAGAVDLRQRATRTFSMLSVSWTDPAARPQQPVQVRTRDARTGRWSGWRELGIAEGSADLPVEADRVAGATEPLWAGRSSGVAVRIARGALPAGLKLNLIDPDVRGGGKGGGQGGGEPDPGASPSDPQAPPPPEGSPAADPATPGGTTPADTPAETAPTGTTPAEATPPGGTPSGEPATGAPGTTPPVEPSSPQTSPTALPTPTGAPRPQLPPYVSRSGWNADETLVTDPISVAPAAKMVFVHHTGFGNGSTCADSASIVRGIQANDVKVKKLSDMGYNFLVDRCGTLFEGRKGGVGNAVVGAHTVGFNTGSVGVALLGDYTTVVPAEAALTTIAQVAAARLGAYGLDPTGEAQMTEGVDGRKWPLGSTVTFPRVSGHKDGEQTAAGFLTECPGNKLYPLLASIRARSVQQISGLAAKSLGGGVAAAGNYYVRTAATVTWAVETPSSSIARFELLRDGQVAATAAGSARSGSVPVPAGTHTVAVRAVHTSGSTATTAAYRVIGDNTAPTFGSAPAPALRTGTYATTSVPVSVVYRVSDNVRLWSVGATSPARVTLSTGATSWAASMRPGANTAFTVTARDVPGNSRTASVTRKATIIAETSAKRGGSWTTRSGGSYLSSRALAATKKGAKLTYTFTGRSAALMFSRGAATGKADILVDGRKVATVDTRATRTAYRQAIWVRTMSAGKHTVAVVVAGTSGRPTVVSDGLAYLG
nr:N-acetylmuramoyl-L-alanine amidase [uncultured Actinoplanes sp.]